MRALRDGESLGISKETTRRARCAAEGERVEPVAARLGLHEEVVAATLGRVSGQRGCYEPATISSCLQYRPSLLRPTVAEPQ
jgi:hypothetical protein